MVPKSPAYNYSFSVKTQSLLNTGPFFNLHWNSSCISQDQTRTERKRKGMYRSNQLLLQANAADRPGTGRLGSVLWLVALVLNFLSFFFSPHLCWSKLLLDIPAHNRNTAAQNFSTGQSLHSERKQREKKSKKRVRGKRKSLSFPHTTGAGRKASAPGKAAHG